MGGRSAPIDPETRARTQAWLTLSNEPVALVSGRYWHILREEPAAKQATDLAFQDKLIAALGSMTGVQTP